jgi:hypothetical protein
MFATVLMLVLMPHSLVRSQPGPGEPIRQVCSLTLHEYAASFIWDDDYVGAYPTWNTNLQQTVRPGNELCLMRNMSSPAFCAPCIEGMWHQFMMRMSLIDGVDVSYEGQDARVSLLVVPLGQFREEPIPGIVDRYTVSYTRDGVAQPQFDGMFVFDVGPSLTGEWTAEVRCCGPRCASWLSLGVHHPNPCVA